MLAGAVAGLAIHAGGLVDRGRDTRAAGTSTAPDDPGAPGDASPSPVASTVPGSTPPASPPSADAAEPIDRTAPVRSYHDGIMRAAPSVVSLYAGLHERIAGGAAGDGPRPRLSQGSGVIVDPDGIVLTNLHLVEDADAINVVLGDGTLLAGTLVGSDRETDLAVVRVEATDLPAMRLDAAPPLRVGDVVLAIGNPFGVGQTVTQGIVSATRRRVAGGSAWQDFVQIDAAINPGNSGGALINPDGELVGVTTAVFRGGGRGGDVGAPGEASYGAADDAAGAPAEGIGFAIPAELLARVVPSIIADGRVVRGWLGIGADDLPMFPALHRRVARGAVITGVLPDSPAARGGLRRQDVVTRLDGRAVEDATDLLLLVSSLGPGTPIRLGIDRDGRAVELALTLDERPPPTPRRHASGPPPRSRRARRAGRRRGGGPPDVDGTRGRRGATPCRARAHPVRTRRRRPARRRASGRLRRPPR